MQWIKLKDESTLSVNSELQTHWYGTFSQIIKILMAGEG